MASQHPGMASPLPPEPAGTPDQPEASQAPAPSPPPEATDDAPTIISRTIRSTLTGGGSSFTNLLRGKRLAHFELLEPIGIGGMAAVVRARDLQLDRIVALKILPPDVASDPEIVKRFENEARSTARLDHENIARVFYCGADQGLHFIAFEYVEGENLRVLLERQGRIPVSQAVHFTLQIATGLVHAAERNVVHRDIKPSNIIVGPSGRAKLVDMGLARNREVRPDDGLTQSGVTLGTFDYISPEQAIEPRAADVRSDIYSLGCTLYHLVTGVPPVPDGTPARKLHFHQNEEPLDPRQLNGEIPDELAAILSRMMAKDPKDRYQRPEIVVQHLLALARKLEGQNGSTLAPDMLFVDSVLPAKPQTQPLLLFVLGAAAIVVLVIILGPTLTPQPREQPVLGSSPPSPPPGRREVAANPPGREPRAGGPAESMGDPGVRQASTAAALIEFMEDARTRVIELTDGSFDLVRPASNGVASGGFVLRKPNLMIRARTGARPVLRLPSVTSIMATLEGREARALVIDGGVLTLQGLQIEFAVADAGRPSCGICLEGSRLILEECELREVADEGSPSTGTAFIRVGKGRGSDIPPAVVELHGCVGYGGDGLLLVEEGAQVFIEDSILGGYRQPIRLTREDGQPHLLGSRISVERSSWLLGAASAVMVDSQQTCKLELRSTILSQIPTEAGSPLILLGKDQGRHFRLESDTNYYHDVRSLLARELDDGTTEVVVQDLLGPPREGGPVQDTRSTWQSASPWEEAEPLRSLARGNPAAAIRVKTGLAALRPARDQVLGPRRVLGRDLYPGLDKLPFETAVASPATNSSRELIVDGLGAKPGTYKTVASALSETDTDDEVLITAKWSGPLYTRQLDIGNRKVTIRAAAGSKPELLMHPDHVPGAAGDVTVFRLHDGELHLEQLLFKLSGLRERDAVKLQSLLTVTGTGRCRMKACAATLMEEPSARTALVVLDDPTGAMMGMGGKTPRIGMPALELEDCVVRGQGDMIAVPASRPFRLDCRNALVTLGGSLLVIDGNRPEASALVEGAMVNLERVTAYLTQSLLLLRASTVNPVHVPVRITSATTCVFASAEGNPLLRIEGPQSEEELKRRLTWQGRRNFYGTTGSILLWQPLQKEDMPHRYDGERWGELWGRNEEQPGYGRSIRFGGYPSPSKILSDVIPADFRILSTDPPELDVDNCGADLERLPSPASMAFNRQD